jgi:hypothetical protein
MLDGNLGIYVALHVPVIGDICWMTTWVYMLDYMYHLLGVYVG